jgi:hypothetical protein
MTPVTTTSAVEQQQQQQQQHPPNQHQSVVSKYQEQRRKICEEPYLQPFLLVAFTSTSLSNSHQVSGQPPLTGSKLSIETTRLLESSICFLFKGLQDKSDQRSRTIQGMIISKHSSQTTTSTATTFLRLTTTTYHFHHL